jgi:hypothetical protein
MKSRKVIISCLNDGTQTNTAKILPVGFTWINDLAAENKSGQKLVALLHGQCCFLKKIKPKTKGGF